MSSTKNAPEFEIFGTTKKIEGENQNVGKHKVRVIKKIIKNCYFMIQNICRNFNQL